MAERPWQVAPHDAFVKHEENLWSIRTDLPFGRKGDRRMVIARQKDGRLVFYNAAPLEDAALKELEAWGTPAFLVLPNNLHMVDGHAFQQRLGLEVYGPKGDRKMASRVRVSGSFEELPTDGSVQAVSAAGSRNGEGVLVVKSGDGLSLAFADLVMNVPREGAALLPRLAGFAMGRPVLPWSMRTFVVTDRGALKAQLEGWAPTVKRLLPSHGRIVESGAREALARIATELE